MPPGIGYGRRVVKKRAQDAALGAANVDSAGLDPEMRETLAGEAARRVGAAGVGVRTKTPGIIATAKRVLFGRGK